MNDWNFFVREVGRGRGVQECRLEVTEVSRRGGRRWCRHEAGLDMLDMVRQQCCTITASPNTRCSLKWKCVHNRNSRKHHYQVFIIRWYCDIVTVIPTAVNPFFRHDWCAQTYSGLPQQIKCRQRIAANNAHLLMQCSQCQAAFLTKW